MPRDPHRAYRRQRSSFGLRLGIFITTSLIIIGTAVWLLRPQGGSSAAADITLEVTMGGFTPPSLTIPAGKAVTLKIINPDTAYHMDGGGVHQFAVPELGLDIMIQPKSTRVIELPAAKAGTYAFYCDVCCGGKENPSMQGTITIG